MDERTSCVSATHCVSLLRLHITTQHHLPNTTPVFYWVIKQLQLISEYLNVSVTDLFYSYLLYVSP